MHENQQTAIEYPDPIAPGQAQTFGALLEDANGNTLLGYKPWIIALKGYKKWLQTHTIQEAYPAWLQNSEAFFSVPLQERKEFDLNTFLPTWNNWKGYFSWIQFWGQTSNYTDRDFVFDSDFDGKPDYLPWNGENPVQGLFDGKPPIQPGENLGCCLQKTEIHSRYVPELLLFTQRLDKNGLLSGFFAREPPSGKLETSSNAKFLRDWLEKNHSEYHAPVSFVDNIGKKFVGNPETLFNRLTDGTIPNDAIIGGLVDAYPRASLISGLVSASGWQVGSAITPEVSNSGVFPNFARFVLPQRILFLGESNGEHNTVGPVAYWLERQVFLLGLKTEMMRPDVLVTVFSTDINQYIPVFVQNPYLLDIKAKRNAVQWWNQNLEYWDTIGLTEIPPGMDARRFKTKDGKDWILVDNPGQERNKSLKLKGKTIPIPTELLSIIKVE